MNLIKLQLPPAIQIISEGNNLTMQAKGNIFLIGLMGVGKTTIGKKRASDLYMPFYDSDIAMEKNTHASISWIFELEGEKKFQQRENKIIDELTQYSKIVLATGSGALSLQENRCLLKQRGTIIYLYTAVDVLTKRTRVEDHPLLEKNNSHEVFSQLLQKHEHLYREIANFSYDTGKNNSAAVVQKIVKDLTRIGYIY
jgi:shikimate kinase